MSAPKRINVSRLMEATSELLSNLGYVRYNVIDWWVTEENSNVIEVFCVVEALDDDIRDFVIDFDRSYSVLSFSYVNDEPHIGQAGSHCEMCDREIIDDAGNTANDLIERRDMKDIGKP